MAAAAAFVCTHTDTEHAGEIYNDSVLGATLAGYQGTGNYDVIVSQIIELSVNPQLPNGGFEAGFNGGWSGALEVVYTYSVVPVPAAVWFFVSGLLGLFGVAKRKQA